MDHFEESLFYNDIQRVSLDLPRGSSDILLTLSQTYVHTAYTLFIVIRKKSTIPNAAL